MPKVKISTFDEIGFKDAFENENDFSNWLSDHLEVLSKSVDIPLENGVREQFLGDKRADIIAEIPDDEKSLVLIENQIGNGDHDHLGKLITYSAMIGAKVAIWIAKNFGPEHTRALSWLNDNTDEDRKFYGVKYNVFDFTKEEKKIGFEVIVKPDSQIEFFKKEHSGKLEPRHESRFKLYEMALNEYNDLPNAQKSGRNSTTRRYLNVLATDNIVFSWRHRRKTNETIEVAARILGSNSDQKKKFFDEFKNMKDELERKLDSEILFKTPENRKKSRTNYYIYTEFQISENLESLKDKEFEDVVKWMAKTLDIFVNTLKK